MDSYSFAVVIGILLFSPISSEPCTRHGASCPDYTVIQTHQDYEERMYPSLVWVSTSAEAKTRNEVSRDLIKRLYGYLGGDNSRGDQVDMMVPVRTTKVVGDYYNNYTMSITLAPEHQEDPPLPTNAQVILCREPPTTYVTRSFSGMIRDEQVWERQAQILKAAVIDDHGVNTNCYSWCVYDSPWRETDRLNEVWMVKNEANE